MMMANKKKKGSILVFVLALIVFISVLSIRLMKETTQELRHVSQFHRRDDLRTFAYSALDVAAGVINEYVMALNKLENGQAWQQPLQFAELENPNLLLGFDGNENNINALKWKVQLIDETGKIPFRKVKDKNLEALFAAMVNEEEGGGLFDEDDGRLFWIVCVIGRMKTTRRGMKVPKTIFTRIWNQNILHPVGEFHLLMSLG